MLNNGSECAAKDLKGKRLKQFYTQATNFDSTEFLAGFAFGDGAVHRLGSTAHKAMEVYLGAKDGDIAAMYGQQIGTWYSHQAREELSTYGIAHYSQATKRLPSKVKDKPYAYLSFLAGLYSANGSVVKGHRVSFKTISKSLADDLVCALGCLDISAYITTNKAKVVKFSNGEYECKESYDVNISQFVSVLRFAEFIGFGQKYKQQALAELIDAKSPLVASVNYLSDKEVYDFTEPATHWGVVEGVVVHNSEIILRPHQFCNLSEIVVRVEDTKKDLLRKARLATILGTFQSTLTHFPYLRKTWQKNTEEERLLGVSLTGIMDSSLLNGKTEGLPTLLEELRDACIKINTMFAEKLGIPASAAVTCCKPSGTVSQLTDSSSGIHARHAAYYYRRVRSDIKDPLTALLVASGVTNEPCVMKPDQTMVFTFPKKAPEGAVLREDVTALEHLNLWLTYQRHWCEHKPSVTISVKENEWMEVGAFVWKHFDEMSGVSFLPYDGGSYRQAPYEDCTKEQYEALQSTTPQHIDWSLKETEDNVEGAQMLACTGGVCEM
jgi:hypothetical protein